MNYKKVGIYFLLLISIFIMCLLFIQFFNFVSRNQIIWAILIVIDFFLFPILWNKYYQTEILSFIREKPSLRLDGYFLVWGALFGTIFADNFLQPLMKLANSGDYLKSFLAILLAIFLFIIAMIFSLFIRLVHGINIRFKALSPAQNTFHN